MTELPVLFRDEHYVAVDKPGGLLVHRTRLAPDRDVAMRRVRDQLGQHVYPVHRLDRPTSGVLVFALSSDAARRLATLFAEHAVSKVYHAVVRGYTPEEAVIDHPIRLEKGAEGKPAVSSYRLLATVELPIPVAPFQTSRYSLVEVRPETGRRHQIRRHFRHISHPLIGDTEYGKRPHNQLFRDHFGVNRLLLMAVELSFRHPYTDEAVAIRAPYTPEVRELFRRLGWPESVEEHHVGLGKLAGEVVVREAEERDPDPA